MPRPKRKYTTRKQESILKRDDSIDSTLMDSKMIDNGSIKLEMWKGQVKDRMKYALNKLNHIQREKLETYELEFNNLLLGFSKDELSSYIDINNEKFRYFILEKEPDENISSGMGTPTTVKRRSKSANTSHYSKRNTRLRSISVDTYKTPKGRVRLSSIMSHKKYTVTKPAKNDNIGVSVKRIMKPDEVAISTCGSPLYVASCSVGAPHVNIPLPGGVVLNIEPKDTNGALEVPGLDAKTKNQIKLLCEQLKKLF
ncbi:hypothetical protein RUM44_008294 [Polyplax serrata]|uniref:Borealin C-terminal domain-containing protein n=1 Tax=Polyplax serrata TaxID=468196 RepID=A0ABR1B833_POLSC